MILRWKKTKKRIENGELCYSYWSDLHRSLTLVFASSPVIVRTKRKGIVDKWRVHKGVLWHGV